MSAMFEFSIRDTLAT